MMRAPKRASNVPPHITVLQPGARLHYAVPEILAKAGWLKRLHTDIHAEHIPLNILRRFAALLPAAMTRLLGRTLPDAIERTRVRDHPWRTFLRAAGAPVQSAEQRMLHDVLRDDLGTGDVLYTTLVNSDLEAVRELRARGVKIVHECIVSPEAGAILAAERAAFPRIETPDNARALQAGRERDAQKYQLADLILAPSDHCRDAVIRLGAAKEKVIVVPYGLDASWLRTNSDPVPGRVLFVGSVGLLKGNHYLAAATRLLRERNFSPLDVRVVGPYARSVIAHPEFSGPDYVGQVPRSLVREEFRRADVLVLPSLSESFGLVQLEALACGVPVITTPDVGAVVRNGSDGLIVPGRAAQALADAIARIVSDRALRERMSRNARERAAEFTLERYGERLLKALDRVR
jgi:glycosyltransferase involved in cell wall biosynthesis